MDDQQNTDGQTICEALSEAIGSADNIFFRGKFKANALFIQERDNEEEPTRHAVQSAISVKNVPSSKSSKISVTLAPKGSPLQLLNNGEFYNLCGEVVVTDFQGNYEFRYSSGAIKHIRYTRAASLPSTVSIIGVGTIRRVRLLPSSRNKETGRTDRDYIELLVGHKSDQLQSGEFYIKYFVDSTRIHIDDAVRLDPGARVQLSGEFCGYNTRRGIIIINVTSGVVGGCPTYMNGPKHHFLSVCKNLEE